MPKTVSELKVALKKISDNFQQVQLKNLTRILQIVRQLYVNGDEDILGFSLLKKKCSHGVCAVLNS